MSEPLIQLRRIHISFDTSHVLRGVDLDIQEGEVTSIIGKSGTGKSVTLKLIIGLLSPDSGRVLFKGRPLAGMKKAEKRDYKRRFSYMFQSTALFDSMTVLENIMLPLKERTNLRHAEILARAREKMDQLDLTGVDNKYPSQLSGGMKKRLAMARALVTEPEIILFDEPTTGLDPIRKNAVHSMIVDYQTRFGFTAVLVSHEVPDIFYISQRIVMLDEGKTIFQGSPEKIRRCKDERVLQFILGLENRRYRESGRTPQPQSAKRVGRELAWLQRHRIAFTLTLLTVENMEEINERLGHIKAQTVLKDFVLQVQEQLGVADTCSRYGLNRVIVIFSNVDNRRARISWDRMAGEIDKNRLFYVEPGDGFCLSVSVGFAEAEEGSHIEHVITMAESNRVGTYKFDTC
ncbi:MAG: ATP-binding cassette domain-containing protein [Desulfobacterales bacterium]|nr:ATP-binding cassette domain-containing protein [Desulfobacterales bacterium]